LVLLKQLQPFIGDVLEREEQEEEELPEENESKMEHSTIKQKRSST